MSIMTIDRIVWNSIYTDAVAKYIGKGMDLQAARSMAREQMDNAFVILGCGEVQENHDTLRDEQAITDGDLRDWQNQR